MVRLFRRTVTKASRIMLPAYIIVGAYIGACYILCSLDVGGLFTADRLQAPSLTVARSLLPMEAWGVIGVGLASTLALALLSHRRTVAVVSLCLGFAAYELWAVFYGISIFKEDTASLVSPAWPFGWGIAHVASAVSLAWDEVQ
jgi:hypothetical protein